ncbi:MAG: deoxyguanosinetriphosphate triphosphohydrolase [Rickettsiales bacterium]|nr:deoxyguanosinetriphosphate triphosphohydrolase [Rickettsiales bacterium]
MNFQLTAFAVDEANSRGRLHKEIYDDSRYRSIFGRDRDRIINSSAFRRLQYKTQVFVNHEGDHYRTRLTHSLEVAQIARWIAGALKVNKDLAEIVALAHDLGHTPFGHAGEEALNDKMKDYGGFSHNAHTLKIITKLETRFIEFEGLNLSWEMLEGVVKHNGPILNHLELPDYISEYNSKHDLDLKNFPSIEAQISAVSDDIAYNSHDIEDGLRAGLFKIEDLFYLPIIGDIYREVIQKNPNFRRESIVGEANKRLVLFLVTDVIDNIKRNLRENKIVSTKDVYECKKLLASFSPRTEFANQTLKKFLMQNMYRHSTINRMTLKAKKIIGGLFDYYMQSPGCLPGDLTATAIKIFDKKTLAIFVADYIAGMTDRYAIKEFEELV